MLIPCSLNGGPSLAVFIRNFNSQSQFYAMQGKWVHRPLRICRFSVSQFFVPSAVDRILPYLPTEEVAEDELDKTHALDISVPRELGADLVDKMLGFYRAADGVFRKNSERLDNAHEILAHPTKRSWISLEEAAVKLLSLKSESRPSDPTLWAVHRVLMRTDGVRMGFKKHRLSPIFDIIPQSEINEISRVRQWLREYQEDIIANAMTGRAPTRQSSSGFINPFYQFFSKARTLIAESRKTRAATPNGLGPSSIKVVPIAPHWAVWKDIPSLHFNSRERQILEFMSLWVNSATMGPGSTLRSLGPMVLRAVRMYEGFTLGIDTGTLFLQEMGVVAPWHNRVLYNTTLNLPGHRMDPETDRLHAEAKRSSGYLVMKDSMQDLRRDWADTEVFCIDDTSASERDDGISLEPVHGHDSQCWIHIHIANPSAFISKDSSLGLYARHVTQSIYLPEQRFPMLEPSIVDKYFSLANDRPAITFSARLGDDGEILETAIVNGILRNVRHVTRQTLRQYLTIDDGFGAKKPKNITVGGGDLGLSILPVKQQETRPETTNSLTVSHIATLRRLSELGAARRQRRERNGAIDFISQQVPRPEPKVYSSETGNNSTIFSVEKSLRTEGDPIISLNYHEFEPILSLKPQPSETLVPDCMILAGEIAAMWCSQRNIPIPYRGTLENPEPVTSPERFKREVIDRAVAEKGFAPLVANLHYSTLIGQSHLSATPSRHTIMGAPYYCKITSPLRRYADLMAHWQIEAAIRREAQTGTTLIGNKHNDSYLPFPFAEAEATISHIYRREDVLMACSRGSVRHWLTQLLFRAFYYKEAPLPEVFEVYIYSASLTDPANFQFAGLLKELGLSVYLAQTKTTEAVGGIGMGDRWEARIEQIACHKRYILMTPFRLIAKGDIKW